MRNNNDRLSDIVQRSLQKRGMEGCIPTIDDDYCLSGDSLKSGQIGMNNDLNGTEIFESRYTDDKSEAMLMSDILTSQQQVMVYTSHMYIIHYVLYMFTLLRTYDRKRILKTKKWSVH